MLRLFLYWVVAVAALGLLIEAMVWWERRRARQRFDRQWRELEASKVRELQARESRPMPNSWKASRPRGAA